MTTTTTSRTITADLGGEATLGRTSSALTEQGDLRAARVVGRRLTLPMSVSSEEIYPVSLVFTSV